MYVCISLALQVFGPITHKQEFAFKQYKYVSLGLIINYKANFL